MILEIFDTSMFLFSFWLTKNTTVYFAIKFQVLLGQWVNNILENLGARHLSRNANLNNAEEWSCSIAL